MAESIVPIAMTGIVERGGIKFMITKEALESMVEHIAEGRAVPIIVDHSPFCLPIGKISDASIEPFGEVFAVVARIQYEDNYSIVVHERSGGPLVHLGFEGSPNPFVDRGARNLAAGNDTLSVDLANFASDDDYHAFRSDVLEIDNSITCDDKVQRHSLGPEPLLEFVISNPVINSALAVGIWIAGTYVRYTVDATLRSLADETAEILTSKMKRIMGSYRNRRPHDQRDVISRISIPGDPEIVLLVESDISEEFPTIDLGKLVAEMEVYGDLLQQVQSAVFARMESDDWKLQYLMTRTGEVIATPECYKRTGELIERLERDVNRDASDCQASDSPSDSDS